MSKQEIIEKTADYIKKSLSGESSGHDWWHTYRVWKVAERLAKEEKANSFVVQLAALLHDIADYKLNNGDEEIGPRLAGEWLEKLEVDTITIENVKQIISSIAFKGIKQENKNISIEAKCVQDADRLDAIGAIGIARCFTFGGNRGNVMHDPSIKPNVNISAEQYKKSKSTQINHFYEKLLLLKDLMNTKSAKKIAEKRQKVMESFLKNFFLEWEAKD